MGRVHQAVRHQRMRIHGVRRCELCRQLSALERTSAGVQPERKRQSHGRRRQHRLGGHLEFLDLRLLQSFRLGASVLEPYLDLRLREVERRRELGPLRYREVLLLAELPLQREELLRRERRPRLAVTLVFAQLALLRVDARRAAQCCNRGVV